MIRNLVLSLVVVAAAVCAPAQDDSAAYVAAQFGPSFNLLLKYPVLNADLDGDGKEDAVFVATGTNTKVSPLTDQLDYKYKVVDPYDAYFGFGDPKITVGFAAHDPDRVKYILVVHDWKAATPKGKLVIINLPFETLSITRHLMKKKTINAITAEELGGMASVIFWDGKKYRWEALTVAD